MSFICRIPSPIGLLTVRSDGSRITGLWIAGQKYFPEIADAKAAELPVFGDVRKWLDDYFDGREPSFSLPLAPQGSAFRQSVWRALCDIPYGRTATYGAIAGRLEGETGRRVSARAVGGAVAHNPISILIPCHRVVGADGSLTGYAGGVAVKARLLQGEHASLDAHRR